MSTRNSPTKPVGVDGDPAVPAASALRPEPRARQLGDHDPTRDGAMQALSPSVAQHGGADLRQLASLKAPTSRDGLEDPGRSSAAAAGSRPRADALPASGFGDLGTEYGRYSGGYGGRGPSRDEPWRAGRAPHETSWIGRPEPGRAFDPEYHRWRAEQLRQMDQDYDTWRQERYAKFCEEFEHWRASRPRPTAAGLDPRLEPGENPGR